MTCLEKYREEHNGKKPEISYMCPNISGEIDINEPDYCPGDNGLDECYKCWNREVPNEPPISEDIINHPNHYNRENAMESIHEMELIFGKQAVMHFCLCNVWKYRYRAADKNGEEDLKKSDWYMRKYQELAQELSANE